MECRACDAGLVAGQCLFKGVVYAMYTHTYPCFIIACVVFNSVTGSVFGLCHSE